MDSVWLNLRESQAVKNIMYHGLSPNALSIELTLYFLLTSNDMIEIIVAHVMACVICGMILLYMDKL